ncbi:sulfotransferase family protein [Thalassospira xiamenensis]|uniref:Sulfotransferase family protein n=1 Tax=Thalassospira xiamenensis TaxID=220697 RepID=A0A285U1U6_9PROT|nr:sulfotransferase [Thalassospira xiamenensis]SOC30127.1 Sulfotransferase family protein [Thalassospira xiamenensis]
MRKNKAYFNLNKTAWENVSQAGLLDAYTLIVRKKILGSLFSFCGKLQFSVFEDRLSRLQTQPHIVITGHWRSGTTYLHTLICCDPQFTFPSTDSCMNPHAFMLGSRHMKRREVKRPMDDVIVTSTSPQEDEFALMALGARSPYEGLMFPESLETALSLADIENLDERERKTWKETFRNFIKGVSLLGQGRPVVIKSPTHSCRLKAISDVFPNSRFIYMNRNPLEVFESTFRMWRSLFDLYSLGRPICDNALREIILQNRIVMEKKFAEGEALLSGRMVAHVDYQRLVDEPLQELRRIYVELNIDPEYLSSKNILYQIEKNKRYRAQGSLPPAEWQRRVLSAWSDFM